MSKLIALEGYEPDNGGGMIGSLFDPHDPQRTVRQTTSALRTVSHLAGYLAGMNGTDLESLEVRGIPGWAVAIVAASAGALVFTRFAPEPWLMSVRNLGK
jgi:hypothetical protein